MVTYQISSIDYSMLIGTAFYSVMMSMKTMKTFLKRLLKSTINVFQARNMYLIKGKNPKVHGLQRDY